LLKLEKDFGFLDSVEFCRKELGKRGFEGLKNHQVRSVMREELQMRYRKVKAVALHENSTRNLVLRQRWAMKLLELAPLRTRLVNIDETWLGMEDFRRMKWQLPGSSNVVPKKAWSPRISMLLAFDNFGESYVALS
jgi:hypothetical protein